MRNIVNGEKPVARISAPRAFLLSSGQVVTPEPDAKVRGERDQLGVQRGVLRGGEGEEERGAIWEGVSEVSRRHLCLHSRAAVPSLTPLLPLLFHLFRHQTLLTPAHPVRSYIILPQLLGCFAALAALLDLWLCVCMHACMRADL